MTDMTTTATRSSDPGMVPLASVDEMRGRLRRKNKLKGRQPDHVSLEEVQALIGPGPHRRDLLIEYLHLLNDA